MASLVRGLSAKNAKSQLQFMNKKSAGPVLKLLNSAISNAKNSFNIEEDNLYISKLVVDGGPPLKRWMPRAMGRATPILKRTSHVSLVLEERVPTEPKKVSRQKAAKEEIVEVKEAKEAPESEKIFTAVESRPANLNKIAPKKPYDASTESKKRFFSRQTFGNIKKAFRRKAI